MNTQSDQFQTTDVPAGRSGLWRRLAAAFYDSLIVVALWFLGTALILPLTHGRAVADSNFMAILVFRLYLLAIGFAYLGGFWLRTGQTLGMLAWRLRVVQSANGAPITWKQALIRYCAAILSWSIAGMGFAWAMLNSKRKTWHDLLSGTELRLTPALGQRPPLPQQNAGPNESGSPPGR